MLFPVPPARPARSRDQQYAASRRLLALAGVKLRQHLFQAPVLLRLANDPPRPAASLQRSSSSGSGIAQPSIAPLSGEQGQSNGVVPAVEAAVRNGGLPNSNSKAAASVASAAAAGLQSRRRRSRRQNYQQHQQQGQQQPQEQHELQQQARQQQQQVQQPAQQREQQPQQHPPKQLGVEA
jgi:hypothetical protein